MKTICRLADYNPANVSIFVFDDAKPVEITAEKTIVGDPASPDFYIADCSANNAVLYEGVTPPDDYTGWKYFYTPSGGWVLNPDFVPPTPPVDNTEFVPPAPPEEEEEE